MTAETVLCDMTGRGITLIPNGDRLDVEAPDDLLTDDLIVTLRQHKAELLAILTEPSRCPICADRMNLQDRARDCWWCAGCRRFFDGHGLPYRREGRE